jgi:hypothetical protein
MDADQLETAQAATSALNTLAWVLPVLAFVFLGVALWLSPNRRRTLLRWAIGAALGVALVGVGLAVGRSLYLDAVTSDSLPRETATAVFDTLVRFLRTGLRVVGVLALIVALVAWLAGPSRVAVRVRGTGNNLLGRGGSGAAKAGWNFGGFGRWVAGHRGAIRVGGALVAFSSLLLFDAPTPRTVLLVGLLLVIFLAAVEIVARAAVIDLTSGPETPTVEGSTP